MGSASFEFIAFALLVVIMFNLQRSVAWRQIVLLVANVTFLSFFSHDPIAWAPLAAFLAYGYFSVRVVRAGSGRLAFVPLVIGGIVAFVWLKKYAFLPSESFLGFPYLTLGLSYIFFRVLHLIIDTRDGGITGSIGVLTYLNYTLNFTTLLSGPIQRYQDFAAMQLAPEPLPLDVFLVGKAVERIIIGFFKVNVLSLVLSMAQGQALAALQNEHLFSERVLGGIVIAASYPLYLYCNFSGYIDIVIGIARLLRLELPENFNRPFASDNFMVFWSRWHITLSEWLKTYVYNPLLLSLMRRYPSASIEPFLGVFAFFVTFFLVGVWHGQTTVFLFFGVLQGLGVSVTKLYQILMSRRMGRKQYRALANDPMYNFFARGLTFTWFTFTLLWFWSSWAQLGAIAQQMGPGPIAAAWVAILLGSAVVIEVWERTRVALLSVKWASEPILLSRYVRTVWGTALAAVAIATVLLLNAPAPDIVYKSF